MRAPLVVGLAALAAVLACSPLKVDEGASCGNAPCAPGLLCFYGICRRVCSPALRPPACPGGDRCTLSVGWPQTSIATDAGTFAGGVCVPPCTSDRECQALRNCQGQVDGGPGSVVCLPAGVCGGDGLCHLACDAGGGCGLFQAGRDSCDGTTCGCGQGCVPPWDGGPCACDAGSDCIARCG